MRVANGLVNSLYFVHTSRHRRVSRPCMTHGLCHRHVFRPCVPCTLILGNKMLRIEHTGRDMCMCLSRVRDTASSTGVCPECVTSAPILA
ncbi:hypothetical protein F383_00576 [Gossypium arboreum]|uniref:Uncharacterized protein n=1 Tax=Gossypium arboreum TaxID=29729 RepID=A0A0B0NZE5_GOSAR|nr:hypothetical protein F383_00576 [Gossypium arboreum]